MTFGSVSNMGRSRFNKGRLGRDIKNWKDWRLPEYNLNLGTQD